MTKLYALVKWVSGEDKGKFTVGIPVNWIINFDYEDFKKENYDPDCTYVIQWRKSVKEPPGGWLCFDGLVTDVSSSLAVLEKKFETHYNGLRSPKDVSLIANQSSNENSQNQTKKNNEKSETSCQVNNSTAGKSDGSQKLLKGHKRSLQYGSESESDLEGDGSRANISGVETLTGLENSDTTVSNAQVLQALQSLRGLVEKNQENKENNDSDDEEPVMVTVGKQGDSIKITDKQWECVNSQPTPTAMAVNLVTAVFPLETLLKSNTLGGKARIWKHGEAAPQHKGLDPQKLHAIKYTVRKKFKNIYNEAKINSAINTKLNTLRKKKKVMDDNPPVNAQS